MPKDNIQRAINKASGADSENYEEVRYEGYGPGGVAFFVETLTDNRNRTIGDVRHAFTKCGGNVGTDGSVAWMFERKGEITLDFEGKAFDEDEVMMTAIDAGAEDVERDGERFFITTALTDLYPVREKLEAAGYTVEEAKLARVPSTMIAVDAATTPQVVRLIELLEDNDDVQHVFHNADLDQGALESM